MLRKKIEENEECPGYPNIPLKHPKPPSHPWIKLGPKRTSLRSSPGGIYEIEGMKIMSICKSTKPALTLVTNPLKGTRDEYSFLRSRLMKN